MHDEQKRAGNGRDSLTVSKAEAVKPAYRPPRIQKKRSVSRATLLTGSGPDAGGIVG